MGIGRKNSDEVSDQITSQDKGQDKSSKNSKKCETCDGRGVRPEVSVSELCQDCGGSGTIEA